jgi:hypothetical protein
MGRFISQDPIGFAAGDANLYRYVGNKPSNATDPTGLVEDPNLVQTYPFDLSMLPPSGVPSGYRPWQGPKGEQSCIGRLVKDPAPHAVWVENLEENLKENLVYTVNLFVYAAGETQRQWGPGPGIRPGSGVMPMRMPMRPSSVRPSNAIVSGSHRPSVTIKPSAPKGPTPPSYSPVGPDGNKLPLPKGPHGQLAPSSEYPHSQIGWYEGRKGGYVQTLEFGPDGKPIKRIDWTDHGRPKEHTNPHCHDYLPNPTGGNHIQGPARPLTPVERGE